MSGLHPAGDELAAVGEAHILDTPGAGPASIRGGAVRVIGYGGGLLMTAVSAPLIIRHLGLIDFGRYTTAISVVAVTSGLTEFGLRDAATREYTTAVPATREALMASTLGIRLTMSLIGVVFGCAFALLAGYGGTLVLGVLVAGFGVLLNSVQVILAVPLAVDLRLIAMTALDLLQQFLIVLLTIACVLAGLGVFSFLSIQLVAPIPPLIATAWLVRRTIRLRVSLHPGAARSILLATLPFTAVTLVAVVYFRLSIIVISLVSTKLQTGYFATSYRVIEALIYIPSVLVAAAFPILSRAAQTDQRRFAYAFGRLFDVAAIGGAAFAILLGVGAPLATAVLVGSHGSPVIPILRVHALVMPSSFLIALGGYALLSLRRPRAVVLCVGAGLAVNALLLAILVPAHGAMGGAVAGASGEATIALLMVHLLLRSGELRISGRTVGVVVLASALALAVAALPGWPAVPATAASALVFAAVILAGRVLPEEILAAVRRR